MELSKHAYAAFAVQIHNCSAFETFQVFCFLFERQKLLWKRPRCIENEIENLQYFVCVCCQFGRLKPLLRDCHTNIFIYRNAECAARCFGPVKSLIFFFFLIYHVIIRGDCTRDFTPADRKYPFIFSPSYRKYEVNESAAVEAHLFFHKNRVTHKNI